MTVYQTKNDAPRVYVTAKQAQYAAQPKPRTDAEIEAELRESVKRNASTHKALSKL